MDALKIAKELVAQANALDSRLVGTIERALIEASGQGQGKNVKGESADEKPAEKSIFKKKTK